MFMFSPFACLWKMRRKLSSRVAPAAPSGGCVALFDSQPDLRLEAVVEEIRHLSGRSWCRSGGTAGIDGLVNACRADHRTVNIRYVDGTFLLRT